jgi:Kef-type K+ transport system membrane component KefB
MEEPGFSGLLIVVAVAFAAPFLLGLTPRLRLPSVVFEIVAGIIIGPSVLGWVEVDETISVLALMGLAILLFLAGLEIDFGRLRGRLLGLPCSGGACRS